MQTTTNPACDVFSVLTKRCLLDRACFTGSCVRLGTPGVCSALTNAEQGAAPSCARRQSQDSGCLHLPATTRLTPFNVQVMRDTAPPTTTVEGKLLGVSDYEVLKLGHHSHACTVLCSVRGERRRTLHAYIHAPRKLLQWKNFRRFGGFLSCFEFYAFTAPPWLPLRSCVVEPARCFHANGC